MRPPTLLRPPPDKTAGEILRELIWSFALNYKLDLWYRTKYNIRFNSPEHRALTLIDMRIAYEDEQLRYRLIAERDGDVIHNSDDGQYVDYTRGKSQKKIDKEFDELDISKLVLPQNS